MFTYAQAQKLLSLLDAAGYVLGVDQDDGYMSQNGYIYAPGPVDVAKLREIVNQALSFQPETIVDPPEADLNL